MSRVVLQDEKGRILGYNLYIPSTVIHIGSHIMSEIEQYPQLGFKKGWFVEPMPMLIPILDNNLKLANKNHHTQYKSINKLISDEDDVTYRFNVFRNKQEKYSGSSSIYQDNKELWKYDNIQIVDVIEVQSARMDTLIEKYNMFDDFSVIIDVQGAELLVLESFGKYLDKIKFLTIEVSDKEYYRGIPTFHMVDSYLTTRGFRMISKEIPDEGDVMYVLEKFKEVESKKMKEGQIKNIIIPKSAQESVKIEVFIKRKGLIKVTCSNNVPWTHNPVFIIIGGNGEQFEINIGTSDSTSKMFIQSCDIDLIT